MTVPSDLVAPTYWGKIPYGVLKLLTDDLDVDLADPFADPPRLAARLGALFEQGGGVHVVDSGDLESAITGGGSMPVCWIALAGIETQPMTNGVHIPSAFTVRIVIKADPVQPGDTSSVPRADIIALVQARIMGDRYNQGAGRIPDPADTGKILSHGMLEAAVVTGATAPPTEDQTRDDFLVKWNANLRLDDYGRWEIC